MVLIEFGHAVENGAFHMPACSPGPLCLGLKK
jgi:hypothetical protein